MPASLPSRSLPRVLTSALLGVSLATVVSAAPSAAVPGSHDDYPHGFAVRPTELARGPAPTVLHMVGRRIIHGPRNVTVHLPGTVGRPRLVDRARNGYVVQSYDESAISGRLWRVNRAGAAVDLGPVGNRAGRVFVSDNGTRVALPVNGNRRTRLVVRRTSDGTEVATTRLRGYVSIVDFPRRVVLSRGSRPVRTLVFDPRTSRTATLLRREARSADLRRDRATILVRAAPGTGYDGFCVAYTRITSPADELWRSCTEIPFAFSPRGTRMVTASIDTDGLGIGVLQVRGADSNRVQATLRPGGFFGLPHWEDEDSFLVPVWRRGRAAIVRFDVATGTLERVSRVVRERPTEDKLRWTFPNP